jgi:cell division protein FtsQ
MPRPARPSRLIPQQPARKKQGILRRGQPRNSLRRRWGPFKVWPRVLWITLGLAGLTGFCLGLVILYYQLLTCSTFCITDVKNIEIIGNQRFSRDQILEMAQLDARTNLLALRPSAVELTLEAHPWIASVELERRWPNHLVLHLTERRPLALVQLEELYYTDRNGSLFKPTPDDPHDFPVITGLTREHFSAGESPPSELVVQVIKLLALFQEAPEPLTSSQVAEIHVDPERGFTLYLSGLKTALDLGFTDLPEKVKKLPQVWPFLLQRGYLARTGRINFDHPHRLLLSLKGVEKTDCGH